MKSVSHFLMVGWLAILLAGIITADVVVDVAFESPEISDGGPVSEEPDNSAEHVLMPSQRGDHLGDFTPHQLIAPIAASIQLQPHLVYATGWPPAYFSDYSSPRGPSFLLALRI
jgi:hypothetical protein